MCSTWCAEQAASPLLVAVVLPRPPAALYCFDDEARACAHLLKPVVARLPVRGRCLLLCVARSQTRKGTLAEHSMFSTYEPKRRVVRKGRTSRRRSESQRY